MVLMMGGGVMVVGNLQGQETIEVLTKTYGGEDAYGNPIEVETSYEIKNALVAQQGSIIEYDMFSTNPEIEIVVYVNKKWHNVIKSTDVVLYNGKRYEQVNYPTLWKPFKGSIIKPKLIIGLKTVG